MLYPLSYEGGDAQATYQRLPAGTGARQPSQSARRPRRSTRGRRVGWSLRLSVPAPSGRRHLPTVPSAYARTWTTCKIVRRERRRDWNLAEP
jgi:hypothetical protein